MIEIKGLTKIYKSNSQVQEVIATNNISYRFKKSGFYFVIGKSGCGKTTLLNLLSGLDGYDSGQILLNGEDIKSYNEEQLDEYRNTKIGIIFQQYNLLPDINIYDNLRLVLELQEWDCNQDDRKEDIDSKISTILDKVGIPKYENRRIDQLSGGEQQRVAIARTLLKSPDIIFADEPTGNLDENTGKSIMQLLKSLSKDYLIIMVSHDIDLAYEYGDYIINMSDGQIKNVEELEKRNYNYSFSVETNNNDKITFSNLQPKYMLYEIEKLLSNIENGETLKISEVKKHAKNEEEEQYFTINERKNIRTKKLSDGYKLRFAFEYLKKRKVRLLFTTIVTALSILLLFFSIYINFYNKEEIILKYMEENSPAILPVYIETKYIDDFYIEHEKDIKTGDYLNENVELQFSGITNIAKCVTEQAISQDVKMFPNATMIFCDDFEGVSLDLSGCLPNEVYEVAVTDYIAAKMNISMGDIIEWQGRNLKIVGVIKTNYIEYQLDRKLNYGIDDDFLNFNCEYKYYAVYAKSDLLYGQNQKSSLTIRYSDFLYEKKDSLYYDSFTEIGNSEVVSESNLLKGRIPLNEKEILVSSDFLHAHSLQPDDVLGKEYFFKNIHSPIYNNYYSDAQNMYSYYEDGLTVVGVIETETDDITKDIYVYSTVWSNLLHDSNIYFCAQPLLLPQEKEYKNIVNTAAKDSIMFNEPAVNNIVKFNETVQNLKFILAIILFVVVALNFILIGTFINISINENQKNIGILRSLGVTMSDCMHIFSMEFYAIYMSSIGIATFSIFSIIHIVNDFFSQGLVEVKYDIIKFNVIVYLAVAIIEFVIGYISMRFPISRMKKKKPIEIIQGIDSLFEAQGTVRNHGEKSQKYCQNDKNIV